MSDITPPVFNGTLYQCQSVDVSWTVSGLSFFAGRVKCRADLLYLRFCADIGWRISCQGSSL